MKKILDNKVTLNPVELCDELATRDLFNHYRNVHYSTHDLSNEEIEDLVYVEEKNEKGTFVFTELAQDMYNEYYDEYWTLLEKLAL